MARRESISFTRASLYELVWSKPMPDAARSEKLSEWLHWAREEARKIDPLQTPDAIAKALDLAE